MNSVTLCLRRVYLHVNNILMKVFGLEFAEEIYLRNLNYLALIEHYDF